MAAAAYQHLARDLDDSDLHLQADLIREVIEHPGFKFLRDSIEAHKAKVLQRLVHEGTKPEDVPYLRGQLNGLEAVREAADSITRYAEERATATQQELTHA